MKSMSKTWEENPWKVSTFIIGGLVILLLCSNLYSFKKEITYEKIRICNSIEGTPAWVDNRGSIIGYGLIEQLNSTKSVIDEFMEKKITFVYNPNCGYCKMQIELFGDDWKKYQKSGLTLNCDTLK